MVANDAVAAMVEHHAVLYADLADPVALLRGDTARRKVLAVQAPVATVAAWLQAQLHTQD